MSDKPTWAWVCDGCGGGKMGFKRRGYAEYDAGFHREQCSGSKKTIMRKTTIKDMRLAADTPIWVDVNDPTLLAPYPNTTISTT